MSSISIKKYLFEEKDDLYYCEAPKTSTTFI